MFPISTWRILSSLDRESQINLEAGKQFFDKESPGMFIGLPAFLCE
jgi:hypothetical protein